MLRRFLDALIHRLQGHVTLSVVIEGGNVGTVWSGWVTDVFLDNGALAADTVEGEVRLWKLETVKSFLVTQ